MIIQARADFSLFLSEKSLAPPKVVDKSMDSDAAAAGGN
jgi:hypothetical protein